MGEMGRGGVARDHSKDSGAKLYDLKLLETVLLGLYYVI